MWLEMLPVKVKAVTVTAWRRSLITFSIQIFLKGCDAYKNGMIILAILWGAKVNLSRSCARTCWCVICHVRCARFTMTSSPFVWPWLPLCALGWDSFVCTHVAPALLPTGIRNINSVPTDCSPHSWAFHSVTPKHQKIIMFGSDFYNIFVKELNARGVCWSWFWREPRQSKMAVEDYD